MNIRRPEWILIFTLDLLTTGLFVYLWIDGHLHWSKSLIVLFALVVVVLLRGNCLLGLHRSDYSGNAHTHAPAPIRCERCRKVLS